MANHAEILRRIKELLQNTESHDDAHVLEAIEGVIKKGEHTSTLDEEHLKRVGPWVLQRHLGTGGSSRVYLAHRQDVPEQKAAVKILVRDAAEHMDNLEGECSILARLKHPNIAYLLDSGRLSDNRPWLALEYVAGQRLDDYCREQKMGLKGRLEVFIRICDAVNFAHRQMVLHQDLKPANILVDAHGQPKLLDFGIASLLNPQGRQDEVTRMAHRVMTPEYASPEQIKGEALTVASDVYSLGVVLYELLVNRRPFSLGSDGPSSTHSSRQTTRVPTPLWQVTNDVTWLKHLKGDLWRIVEKMLRDDSHERYDNAHEVALDLRAYLEGRPISARPQTFAYRFKKFISRHQIIAAMAVLCLALLSAMASRVYQQGLIAAADRDVAQMERDTAQQVTTFLTEIFDEVSPTKALGDIKTPVDLVDRGAERLQGGELKDKPQVRAKLQYTIGRVYAQLGAFDKGRNLLQEALSYYETSDQTETYIRLLNELAGLERKTAHYQAAYEYSNKGLKLAKSQYQAPHVLIGDALNQTGIILMHLNRLEEAQAELEASVAMMDQLHEREKASPLINLASLYNARGMLEEAVETYEKGIASMTRVLEAHHPNVIVALNNLAVVQKRLMRYEAAAATYDRAEGLAALTWGKNHPMYATMRANRGELYRLLGEYDKALIDYEMAMPVALEKFGAQHPNILILRGNLARLYDDMGKTHEAIAILTAAIKDYETGDSLPQQLGRQYNNLANMYSSIDQAEMAESYLRQSYAAYAKAYSEEHFQTTSPMANLATLLAEQERFQEAEDLLKRALAIRINTLGNDHIEVAEIQELLGTLMAKTDRLDAAANYLNEALQTNNRHLGPKHHDTALSQAKLGRVRYHQGRHREAQALLEEASQTLVDNTHKKAMSIKIIKQLVEVLDHLGEADRAQHWRDQLKRLQEGNS